MMTQTRPEQRLQTGLLWDLPTRVTHWLLVILLPLLWWTAKTDRMDVHRWAGFALMFSVLFRIYWGFCGSTSARFSHFMRGPQTTWLYAMGLLKRMSKKAVGHNPLGGISVTLLLLLLLAQALIGLFTVDIDGIESGPLSDRVSFETGRALAHWHAVLFNVLLALVTLHIAAILFYTFFKGHRLVSAMFSGYTQMSKTDAASIRFVSAWRAALGIALAGAMVMVVAKDFRF